MSTNTKIELTDHTYDWPDGTSVARVGKKAVGRLLDGRNWDGLPG